MASSSGSGGSGKNPIPDSSNKNQIPGGSDKNPIIGRPIDQGFYKALWELIYQALGIIIPPNRTPQDAGFLEKPSPEKPPPHPKTLQVVLEAATAKARSPIRHRKKRLRDYGSLFRDVQAKKARKEGKQENGKVRPEVYAAAMRRVLLEEVHRWFDVMQGADEPPQDPARRNLQEYLVFVIQQVGEAGPVRSSPLSTPPVARSYFRVVAKAARPHQLDPPPELQEYLQELITWEVRNLFDAQYELSMYSDDFDDFDDVDYVDDSDDPDDGGGEAGSSMGVLV